MLSLTDERAGRVPAWRRGRVKAILEAMGSPGVRALVTGFLAFADARRTSSESIVAALEGYLDGVESN